MATVEQTLDPAIRPSESRVLPPSWALVRRDFIGELRHRRSFFLAVLVVGLCILFVSLAWPSHTVPLQVMGRTARELFALFAVVHLIAASVIPPGIAALAFASERRQDTLDQLRLSLISTLGLVAAKLLSSVGLVALLFVATLPVLGVQLMLVGVSAGEVLGLAAVVLATAFMSASIGLLCAVVFRRPIVALVMSYIGTALAMGGWVYVTLLPFLLLYFVFGPSGMDKLFGFITRLIDARTLDRLGRFLVWDCVLSPYEAVWNSAGVTTAVVLTASGYRLAVGMLCVLLAAKVLSRPPKPLRVPKERPIDDPEVLWKRRHRFPYYLVDPLRRHPLIADGANPVLARELRHGLGMRLNGAFRIFMITALLAGLLGFWAAWPSGGMYNYGRTLQEMMIFATLITILAVQVLVANVMTKEREQGDFGLLRMTLLTPYEILVGKIGAGLATLSPFLLAVLAAGIPITILVFVIGNGGPEAMLLGFATLLACAWLAFCIAFFMSARTRTTVESLAGGILLNAVVFGGPPLAYMLFAEFDWYFGQDLVRLCQSMLVYLSPLITYFDVNVMGTRNHPYSSDIEVTTGIYVVLTATVALGFALLALAYRHVKKQNARDE